MRHSVLHMRRVVSGSVGAAGAFLLPLAVSACPICNTETGRQVRMGIFGDDFWSTLAIVAAPFPVLLLVLAAMHFGWPQSGKRQSNS